MPNAMSRLRNRFKGNPKMAETFDEKVMPIVKSVRATKAGKPEPEVYAELMRRFTAAGVEVPASYDAQVHAAATRISSLPPV